MTRYFPAGTRSPRAERPNVPGSTPRRLADTTGPHGHQGWATVRRSISDTHLGAVNAGANARQGTDDHTKALIDSVRLLVTSGVFANIMPWFAFHQQMALQTGGLPLTPLTWTTRGDLVTPHPLGGCNMALSPDCGVVDHKGEVFGYRNLYVADGAIVPTAIGLNPSRPIGALAERIASLIAAEQRSRPEGTARGREVGVAEIEHRLDLTEYR